MEPNYWQLKTRSLFIHCPIFKLKVYKYKNQQGQQPYVLFHLPSAKKIVAFTQNLEVLVKTFKFKQQPNAFQIVNIDNEEYLIAGTKKGIIQCQPMTKNIELDSFILNSQGSEDQAYINDISLIDDNHKIVNCFNNGSFCFWDLKKQIKLHQIKNVHQNFTYKIRKVNQKLLSCGNDCKVAVVDLYKAKKTKCFIHSGPVWCVYPLNQNIFSTVGLFNQIHLWDLRTQTLCQTSMLESGQSSFITRFNAFSLIFGDGPTLKSCDLRKYQVSEQIASADMLVSAESIVVNQNGGYVCGRGFEVNQFTKISQINFNLSAKTFINDPYKSGSMYLYSVPAQDDQMEQQQSMQSQEDQQIFNEQIQEEDIQNLQQINSEEDSNQNQIQDKVELNNRNSKEEPNNEIKFQHIQNQLLKNQQQQLQLKRPLEIINKLKQSQLEVKQITQTVKLKNQLEQRQKNGK